MKNQYVPLVPYLDDRGIRVSQLVSLDNFLSSFHVRQIRSLLTAMGLEDHPKVWRRISQHTELFDLSTNFVMDSGLPTERKLLNTKLVVRDLPVNGTTTAMYCVAVGYIILPEVPLVNISEDEATERATVSSPMQAQNGSDCGRAGKR